MDSKTLEMRQKFLRGELSIEDIVRDPLSTLMLLENLKTPTLKINMKADTLKDIFPGVTDEALAVEAFKLNPEIAAFAQKHPNKSLVFYYLKKLLDNMNNPAFLLMFVQVFLAATTQNGRRFIEQAEKGKNGANKLPH